MKLLFVMMLSVLLEERWPHTCPKIKEKYKPQITVDNGENAAQMNYGEDL